MGLVDAFNSAETKSSAAPWENITDGDNVVIVKEASLEEGETGRYIQYKFYYPQWNASEDSRQYFTEHPVGSAIMKSNLLKLNPKFPSNLETDDELYAATAKTLTGAVGGKLKLNRKTNGKYRNYKFLSFELPEIPF